MSLPTPQMKNTIIVGHSPGGLGNILVQLAHITAFCMEYEKTLYAPPFTRVSNLFENDGGVRARIYPPKLDKKHQNIPLGKYLKGFSRKLLREIGTSDKTVATSFGSILGRINIKGMEDTIDLETLEFKEFAESHRFTVLSGWRFRAPNLVIKHADAIRKVFAIQQKYDVEATQLIKPAKDLNRTLVGIHIRRGDYQGNEFFWSVENYISLMQSIKDLVENPVFVVCSNEDIYDQIPKSLDCLFPKGSAIIDLLCMSKCNLIAAPPSTFSGWPSFIQKVPRYKIISLENPPTLDQFTIDSELDGHCVGPVLVKIKDIM